MDNLPSGDSSLKIVMQKLLNDPEDQAIALLREIRACESLDDVTSAILSQRKNDGGEDDQKPPDPVADVPLFNSKLSAEIVSWGRSY